MMVVVPFMRRLIWSLQRLSSRLWAFDEDLGVNGVEVTIFDDDAIAVSRDRFINQTSASEWAVQERDRLAAQGWIEITDHS